MQKIVIEGRAFEQIKNGTFTHDIWVTRKVREAGLADAALREGESHDEFIERLATIAWESGAVLEILGGMMMPAGIDPKEWTPALAAQTAEFFGNVTDEASKRELRMKIGGILAFFFVSALSSSPTSTKSSATAKGEDARRATEDASNTGIGDI